jgi:hypothetical protein
VLARCLLEGGSITTSPQPSLKEMIMRSIASTLLPVLAIAAFGCTTTADDGEGSATGPGGKGDSYSSGMLRELSEQEHATLRAADAECLHMNWTRHDDYPAAIKLICMPHGGHLAPTALYVAAVAAGESSGLYKIFEVPGLFGDNPESVSFRMSGDKAIYTFVVQVPAFDNDDPGINYVPRTVTTVLELLGDPDEPGVLARYSIE